MGPSSGGRTSEMRAAGTGIGPADILRRSRTGFVGVALAGAMVNLLSLSGSIYMLQVYDRVIPARSVATLIGLTVLLALLYACYAVFDQLRLRLLAAIAGRIDQQLRRPVFDASLGLSLAGADAVAAGTPLRDLDQIRSFAAGLGPAALVDLPWSPLLLGLVFLIHPALGVAALAGAVVIIVLTVLAERQSREPVREAAFAGAARNALAEAVRRQAETVAALGMRQRLGDRFVARADRFVTASETASLTGNLLGAVSRVLRLFLQSAILGIGAWLVIHQEATPGVILAASITVTRALAPIEVAIANWRGFLAARDSYARLGETLARFDRPQPATALPLPTRDLVVDGLHLTAPGQDRAILADVSFRLAAGDGLGVIGPSASGKSSLMRALVGVWPPRRGTVRLDGSPHDHWAPDAIGRAIGYLPQEIALIEGTIAENIARFDPAPAPEALVAAARAAGVHDLILRQPGGYDARIGEGGLALSAGQRQRIALARALYGDPFLVVLDEPNSNLDAEGETALAEAIRSVRARGGIAIVVAHRPSALAALDKVALLQNGRMAAIGPKDEVLRATVRAPGRVPAAEATTGAASAGATVTALADRREPRPEAP